MFLCVQPARIIFSTIIDYSLADYKVIIFSLKVCQPNIREVREGEVLGHWRREFMCFWYWVFPHSDHHATLTTQYLQPMNSLPIDPRNSPPLTSLMLSQQTLRLKIITFLAESCGDELIISTENNTNHVQPRASRRYANIGRGLGVDTFWP